MDNTSALFHGKHLAARITPLPLYSHNFLFSCRETCDILKKTLPPNRLHV